MKQTRKVIKAVKGIPTEDGAGVKLQRVLGHHDVWDFDPFLMLDAFDSRDPQDYIAGFPWHPHRGIETVTYLISGRIEHGDSLGNHGTIADGDTQWMTAGGGIIHQEMPQASERMLGAQLWINLPREHKMTQPAYHDIPAASVAKVSDENATVAVISGNYEGESAQMQGNFVKTTYLDVDLNPGKQWEIAVPSENTVFIYIILGSVFIDNVLYENRQAILFGPGNAVSLAAGDRGARFLFLSAKPLKEPIAWGGPIVMNTNSELEEAFRQLDDGTFTKQKNQ